jgi:hypothetical protein
MQDMNFPTYVFATVNPGHSNQVVEELKRNTNIDFVAPVTGRFDLVLRLKQAAPDQVFQWVQSIRQIKGIQSTHTTFGFNGFKNGNMVQNQPLGISLFNITSPAETFMSQLKTFPGLVEAWAVPGQFDVLAFWQAKTTDEIVNTSVQKLPTLQGISRTETLLTSHPFFRM